jgi:hypothetical protein
MAPPRKPSFTESLTGKKESTAGGASGGGSGGGDNPFLDELDKLNPQELADYLYALAEEIIASPEEYKVKMGLQQLDISELDNIDLSTPAGRRKLAKLLRLLAEQALRGKEVYMASVKDSSKDKGRGR